MSQRGKLRAPYTASLYTQARHSGGARIGRWDEGGTREYRGQITWGCYVLSDFVFDFVLLLGTDRVFPVAQVNGPDLVGIAPVLEAEGRT